MATLAQNTPPEVGAELRRRADTIFSTLNPYRGAGLENHCLRLYRFARLLLQREGLALNAGLSYCVAMLHDLGLVADAPGESYLQRSLAIFEEETRGVALDPRQRLIAEEALLFNHRLGPVPGLSREAECFRRAVWVEHSRGLRRYGLEKRVVKQVFRELPRADLDRVLADFARRVILYEPRTLWRGIFL